MLSREASSEPGQWYTDRAPYQRAVMDAFSDPAREEIVVMASSQAGKTEIFNNVVGYYIDQDPSPILVVQPNVRPMAEAWSKDRLAPMLRDTPRLRGKVRDPRSRDSGNTVLHKTFPGGHITVIGANSAAGLSSRPVRIVLFDEVDHFPPSAGTEGDPVSLGVQRTETFWNRKLGFFSTPSTKGVSRIEKLWERSDQQFYYVPCPRCGFMQRLIWKQLKWERDDGGVVIEESLCYQCSECEGLIDEAEKPQMLLEGEWRADRPGRCRAGFHWNALMSPWARWAALAIKWHEVQGDDEERKTFINLKLGELWEIRGQQLGAGALEARAEDWEAEVPHGVGLLTGGVDVQEDRLELLVVGWGVGEESWRIDHYRVEGDTEDEHTWARLEALLMKPWRHEAGGTLRISAVMIDSGWRTDSVYAFVRPRQQRLVWASKGVTDAKLPLQRAMRATKAGVRLWTVDSSAMKDTIFARMKMQRAGPKYMHTRTMRAHGGFDAEFYAQYDAEKRVFERVGDRRVRRYVLLRHRNEALDLEVQAFAAFRGLGPAVLQQLPQFVEAASAGAKKREAQPEAKRPSGRRGRGGFISGWTR